MDAPDAGSEHQRKKSTLKQKVAGFFLFLLSLTPFIIKFLLPGAVTWLELLIFVIAVYQLDIVGMLFGDSGIEKFKKGKSRTINFITALACGCMLLGMDYFLSSVLEIVHGAARWLEIALPLSGYWEDLGTTIQFFGAFAGLGIVFLGIMIIWYGTLKPLAFLPKEDQQILSNTIGGFAMYAVFLGMGGKTLIDYFLVLVNAYYLLRNLRGTRCIKDLVKKIKHAAKTKEKVENSFWAGWINFHKTPRTRFFGTLVTSTALVLGLNFRFLKFDPFQLLFITIAMLPFVLAVLGLKHAWDTNGKVIAAVLPYTGLVALALLVPGAMPVIGLVVGILPDTFLMSLAMMTIFLGIVAISGIGAMAKSVCTTTREAADIATTMVITEFVVQALIAVAFYMALAFNLIYAPLYYDIQLEVPVATAILCIASLVVFYTMRKRFYFKNLYLVSAPSSTPGTAGNESLGNKDGRDMASVAVDAIRRDRLAVSRGKKAIFALIIVCLAAAEVPLSAAATMQPSSTVSHRQAFSTSQYYYINLAVNAPLNVTFSGGIDSVACLVYDTVITPSTLLESAVASSNFTGQLVFHPNGTRHISVVFTIIDDVDNSSDGTVVVFMQTLPEFRLTGIYFLVAGILSVYALLINRLITGKSGRKERMISGG